jgi:hypothetical protein
MNKKLNTAIFIVAATVANLLMMVILFLIPFAILALTVPQFLGSQAGSLLMVLLFFGALVGSFFLYGLIMKKLSEKYNLDQYLHPIFKPKNKK